MGQGLQLWRPHGGEPPTQGQIKRKRGLEEESEAGTLIALANEVRLTSLKLGAETKIFALTRKYRNYHNFRRNRLSPGVEEGCYRLQGDDFTGGRVG